MSLFHDEEDGPQEPVRGLPEKLPAGEHILWQGKPDARTLAIHAFHIRPVIAYIVLIALLRIGGALSSGGGGADATAILLTSALGLFAGVGLLYGLAWLMARASIYTITDKRIVLRYGVAIRKYVNIPFDAITNLALKTHRNHAGSLAIKTIAEKRTPYLHLWPHVRPWRFTAPQPMLRALSEHEAVVKILVNAMRSHAPTRVTITPQNTETPSDTKAGTRRPDFTAAASA